jgi:L-lactate dehydrogenase complex protein LldG
MGSRDRILLNIKNNQPEFRALAEMVFIERPADNLISMFKASLEKIGGEVIDVSDWDDIKIYLKKKFNTSSRIVTPIPELSEKENDFNQLARAWHDVEVAIFQGHFAVAENGAVWITNEMMGDPALPFICQHIALVVNKDTIVPTMEEAYNTIGSSSYDFGTVISGPSKTADIEQSLVLGAHGPKTLVVFLK